jgi:hypothetical protein
VGCRRGVKPAKFAPQARNCLGISIAEEQEILFPFRSVVAVDVAARAVFDTIVVHSGDPQAPMIPTDAWYFFARLWFDPNGDQIGGLLDSCMRHFFDGA